MTGFTDGGTRTTTRPDQPLACVIINPSKRRATTAVRGVLERELHEAGYAGPVWLETSVSEPGTMQARLALAARARLVVAAGGDGTVRSVAAGVAGTQARMGIIPLGTANLAARNLGVPVGNPRAAARVAVHGVDLPADLAWVRTEAWTAPDVGPGRTESAETTGEADTLGGDTATNTPFPESSPPSTDPMGAADTTPRLSTEAARACARSSGRPASPVSGPAPHSVTSTPAWWWPGSVSTPGWWPLRARPSRRESAGAPTPWRPWRTWAHRAWTWCSVSWTRPASGEWSA